MKNRTPSTLVKTLLVAWLLVGCAIALLGAFREKEPLALAGLAAAGSAIAVFVGKPRPDREGTTS